MKRKLYKATLEELNVLKDATDAAMMVLKNAVTMKDLDLIHDLREFYKNIVGILTGVLYTRLRKGGGVVHEHDLKLATDMKRHCEKYLADTKGEGHSHITQTSKEIIENCDKLIAEYEAQEKAKQNEL